MCSLEELDYYLRNHLSRERYDHSVRVMKKALEYAIIYDFPTDIAMKTALGHDIAKELNRNQNERYVMSNHLDFSLLFPRNKYKLHGYVGADILEKNFGFTREMGDAIREHTTANHDMSLLSKILFLADKTEDGRHFPMIEEERELTLKDIDRAMLFALGNTIEHMIAKGKRVDPMTVASYLYFSDLIIEKDEGKELRKVI